MDFKEFRFSIGLRVLILTLTLTWMTQLLYNNGFIITIILLLILAGLQVIFLIKFLEKDHDNTVNFLNAIANGDLLHSYPEDSEDEHTNKLNRAFNRVLRKLRETGKEKEADFQYLKNIVQHVGIGLITFNKEGSIQIMNTAAKKLLRTSNIGSINALKSISPELVELFMVLKTGGQDLIRLEFNGDVVQLAIYAIELTLREERFKLVSLQNIHSELEEKEMEAWQNLVRVLTHEIMNSVTPISSLAGTADESIKSIIVTPQPKETTEELEDVHLAVQTIEKRSKGLIRFVQDFRNLTHIPQPNIRSVVVKPLLEEILLLLKKEIESNDVQLQLQVHPDNMSINADKVLIEQVLINLIKNAIQAFDEQKHKLVALKAYLDDKGVPFISVKDNGTGIDEEALEKIFIPFFTTKKSGSGIGLSLSRQIMRKHQGSLSVKTKIDEGSEFLLKF